MTGKLQISDVNGIDYISVETKCHKQVSRKRGIKSKERAHSFAKSTGTSLEYNSDKQDYQNSYRRRTVSTHEVHEKSIIESSGRLETA